MVSGNPVLLHALLPYWSGHPLSLLLLLLEKNLAHSDCVTELQEVLPKQMPILAELGGPLNDVVMFQRIENMLLLWSLEGVEFLAVYNDFMALHSK